MAGCRGVYHLLRRTFHNQYYGSSLLSPFRSKPGLRTFGSSIDKTPPPMDVRDEDLASEGALWALYERWRRQYNVAHDPEETMRRFNVFKANARLVHQSNRENKSYSLGLNCFGDTTVQEFCRDYVGGRLSRSP